MDLSLSFKNGRPKKWKDVETLQKGIDKYFDLCDKTVVMFKHEEKVFEPYTIEGLCIVLECDRKTLLNYEREEGCTSFVWDVAGNGCPIVLKKCGDVFEISGDRHERRRRRYDKKWDKKRDPKLGRIAVHGCWVSKC